MSSTPKTTLLAIIALASLLACSTTHYRKSADRETYGIITNKGADVVNMEPSFSIEPPELPELADLPTVSELDDALGSAASSELNAHIIPLEKALALSVRYNRTYQNRKESLYLAALDLTLERHRFAPTFSAGGNVAHKWTTTDQIVTTSAKGLPELSPDMKSGVDALAGTPGELIAQYAALAKQATTQTKIVDERTIDGQTSFGVNWLLKGGGQIAVNLTSNFFRYLTGDSRTSTSSSLIGSFTQPLLRGAGRKVAAERLTQAERDVLYALRDYTRFRKVFAVDITTSYYSVLSSRDIVTNNYQSYVAFTESANRDRALVVEGRKKVSDLGRIRQAELDAQNNWMTSIRRYKQNLDNFKIQLGLPVDAPIVLDQSELARLKEAGIQDWSISVDDATLVALHSRLDLYTSRDEIEDAARRVEVAANDLKPGLDLQLLGVVDSKPGDRFQELDFRRAQWSVGLDLDLPTDRKAERNNYRAALIALERADRDLELAVDQVKLEVRDAARNLEEAKRTYEIRDLGVPINENRVEEEKLRAELGRGDALNLIDAQNDLTRARNDLTNALVDHTIARLEFWRDMGILFIKEDGQWQEVTEDEALTMSASASSD